LDSLCDKDFVQSDEFKTRINNLDGIGGIMTKRVSEGLLEYNSVLNGILAHVKFKTIKRDKVENQLIFVHTGDTNKTYFKDRTELKEYIESKGHKMTGSISGKTNYLITENPNSGTVKNKQAKEKGVKIITCAELKDLLG
jgi:DNA ligase (NAD+)